MIETGREETRRRPVEPVRQHRRREQTHVRGESKESAVDQRIVANRRGDAKPLIMLRRAGGAVISQFEGAAPRHMIERFLRYAGIGGDGFEEIDRSEEHTSELQSLMRISSAVFCLKKKKNKHRQKHTRIQRRQTN